MFSLERTILGAVGLLSLALFAGCNTSQKPTEPGALAGIPAPPAKTNAIQLPDTGNNMAPDILDWDATEKMYRANPGELRAPFTFSLTNVSSGPVMIYDTSTTCDCTVASLPSKPWTLPSGGSGQIHATIDLRNKTGAVTNHIIVFTSKGNRRLTVEAILSGQNAN